MVNLFTNVIEISLLCSGIILLIFAVSPLLKQKRTVFWRYVLWIALGVRLVLPFDFSVTEPLIMIPVIPVEHTDSNTMAENLFIEDTDMEKITSNGNFEELVSTEISNQHLKEESVNQSVPLLEAGNTAETIVTEDYDNEENDFSLLNLVQKIDFNLYEIISMLWIWGCVLIIIFQTASYRQFSRSLKKTSKYLFSRDNVPVYSSDIVSSPMLFGILKPQIFLPEREYTEESIEYILNHELTHYKRKDLWVKLLLAAARTIHWFNPFVYQMEKQAGRDMELLCDSQAVQELSKEEKKKYSEMLLACASDRKNNHFHVICSSEFSEDAKTLKERFTNIFADEKRRKGILLAAIGVCAIVAVSVFVTFGNEENSDSLELDETVNLETTTSQEVSLINILLVGNDSFVTDSEFFGNEEGHADTIMVVTLNKEMNRIVLTSFLRDMCVTIPGYDKGKLADSYTLGGKELLVETLKVNFSINIHGVVECDYEDFENVIDTLGGAELKLTVGEAEALNTTNYISNPENRTLEKGLQKLNGNQALGYVRIRSAQDFEGNSGDFARTGRQRRLVESLYARCKEIDRGTCEKLFWGFADGLEITLLYDWCDENMLLDMILWGLSQETEGLNHFCVPMEGSYEAKVIDGRYVLQIDREKVKEALSHEIIGSGWSREEYLFQDKDGWQYYLEEDENQESCIYDVKKLDFVPDGIMLLVRYKDGERQVLEDLIWEDFTKECPVLYMEEAERIIYKAAPTADIIGLKDPVMVSIAMDGSDRRMADTMLYHHFENICEDNGWIYYSGWTNDREYPRPLCRIRPDFEGGPQHVDNLPGILCAVYDNHAFYLASSEVEKPGIVKRNLETGEDTIHDKWGIYADEIAYFHAREKLYQPGELYDREIEGVNIRWSYEYGEEIHNYHVPLYTDH